MFRSPDLKGCHFFAPHCFRKTSEIKTSFKVQFNQNFGLQFGCFANEVFFTVVNTGKLLDVCYKGCRKKCQSTILKGAVALEHCHSSEAMTIYYLAVFEIID